MLFTFAQLKELIDETVYEKQIDTSRWANVYEAVFPFEGKHYLMVYRLGTGDEGECPFEYENDTDTDECPEVEQVEVVKKVWRRVKK